MGSTGLKWAAWYELKLWLLRYKLIFHIIFTQRNLKAIRAGCKMLHCHILQTTVAGHLFVLTSRSPIVHMTCNDCLNICKILTLFDSIQCLKLGHNVSTSQLNALVS